MRELEILLENYWIPKDVDKELFYRIKDKLPEFKGFLNDKLGYHVLINPYVIKLEKLPGKAEAWMGIRDFESPIEYSFLCLLLMFLEDKGREEQFVLSGITEFIQGNYPGEDKIDWTLFRHRKHLIKTLKFAARIGLIRVNDGDEQSFANNEQSEVLYESTGLSRYFMRNFSVNILNYTSYRDIEKEDFMGIDRDRGLLRRQRVYRRLLMAPVVYNEGQEDSDYAYIKNFRSFLENDFEKYLGLPLHIHRNGALVLLPENHSFKDVFPENKTISEIVLQLNAMIREKIARGILGLEKDDTWRMSKASFVAMVQALKADNDHGWSKEYREMSIDKLVEEISRYMESFHLIQILNNQKEIIIMPLVGKIIGRYPEDFKGRVQEEVAAHGE